MKRSALVVIGAALALVAVVYDLWNSMPDEPGGEPTNADASEPNLSPPLAVTDDAARPIAERAPKAEREGLGTKLVLDTPEHAVESAVRALESGDEAAFLKTLLPEIRSEATPDAIARCRGRVASSPVRPDWEVAEDGHDVRRVSMFGKSMTGFHRIGGAWLADRLWCVPTGVP